MSKSSNIIWLEEKNSDSWCAKIIGTKVNLTLYFSMTIEDVMKPKEYQEFEIM
jgi:hypothetical protein